MMRKAAAAVLAAVVLLSVAGCGQKNEAVVSPEAETAVEEAGEESVEKQEEAAEESEDLTAGTETAEAAGTASTAAEGAAAASTGAEAAGTASTAAEEAAAASTGAEAAGTASTAAEGVETASTAAEAASAASTEAAAGILDGGWTRAQSPVVTEEIKALLEKAVAELDGVEYTPAAYLGSQVTAGFNHALLCLIAPVVPNPVEKYGIVYLHEDPKGNAEITKVVDFEGESDVNNLAGGWFQAESPVVTEEDRAAFDKALEDFAGTEYVPVALLSTQVVSGMNYCFLCEATAIYPGAETTYALVYLYQDLEGNSSITKIQGLAVEDN